MIRIYGDVMLDRWIEGDCNRISPEAPVIVIKEKTFIDSIGGAGNLARYRRIDCSRYTRRNKCHK